MCERGFPGPSTTALPSFGTSRFPLAQRARSGWGVDVLLPLYAKRIDGRNQRILDASPHDARCSPGRALPFDVRDQHSGVLRCKRLRNARCLAVSGTPERPPGNRGIVAGRGIRA